MDAVKMSFPQGNAPMAMPVFDVSGIKRKFLDVPYASSPNQTVDIYLPDEGDGPFPTIVFVHGGAFVGGEKRDTQMAYVLNGIRRGYAVVSVDHRLIPEAIFPDQLFDFKCALRFLHANADKYMLDAKRFASAGDSAGGYFALFSAATQDIPAYEGDLGWEGHSSKVQAVIGWCGVYDLVQQSEFTRGQPMPEGAPADMPVFDFADMFAGVETQAHRGLMRFTSPRHFITPAFPPALIQTGDKDQVVPYENSVELAEKIRSVCGEEHCQLDIFPGCTHLDPKINTPENEDRVFAFLDKYLK